MTIGQITPTTWTARKMLKNRNKLRRGEKRRLKSFTKQIYRNNKKIFKINRYKKKKYGNINLAYLQDFIIQETY